MNQDLYGTYESNPITPAMKEDMMAAEQTVDWDEKGLKITRLRLLSDPGFPMWDVSYCFGTLNGKPVSVNLPFHQLPKGGIKGAIIAYAKTDKVYAKGLGIFDCISKLN